MSLDGYINCVKSIALNIDYFLLKMQFDRNISSLLWSASLLFYNFHIIFLFSDLLWVFTCQQFSLQIAVELYNKQVISCN